MVRVHSRAPFYFFKSCTRSWEGSLADQNQENAVRFDTFSFDVASSIHGLFSHPQLWLYKKRELSPWLLVENFLPQSHLSAWHRRLRCALQHFVGNQRWIVFPEQSAYGCYARGLSMFENPGVKDGAGIPPGSCHGYADLWEPCVVGCAGLQILSPDNRGKRSSRIAVSAPVPGDG